LPDLRLPSGHVTGRRQELNGLTLPRTFALFWLAVPLFGQYAGPAILSRGEAPAALAGAQIDFRPYVDITSVYSTGLAGVEVSNTGGVANTTGYGVNITAGISGVHRWRHTKLALDYRGSVYFYHPSDNYDNGDQTLMIGLSHQFTRHTLLNLRETAGMFSRDSGLPGITTSLPFDPTTSYIPNTDFFDNRTIFVSSQVDFAIQQSTRLSFDFGGDFFLNRRDSSALYGVTGESARGDLQYRLTRNSTLGFDYTFLRYAYHGIFSDADIHSFNGTYAVRLTRRLEFSGYAGIARAESKFVQSVPVDPIITQLFGITSTTSVIHSATYLPNINARLSETFHKGVLYVGGGHSVTPGNGLFLTTYLTRLTGGYSYTGIRRWSFAAQGEYDRGDSIANVTGIYGDYGGGISVSRSITRFAHMLFSASGLRYNSPSIPGYNRAIYNLSAGVGFAPGDLPVRVW
jgi:hypothetical protein